MIRRARCDGFVHVATSFTDETSAQRQAPLALTEAGSETGVPFDRLNVAVATIHGRLKFVKRDVFASANEGFHGHVSESILTRRGEKWLAPLSIHKWLAPWKGLGYTGRMPQKPLVRAKQKVRQTRRLAKWRAKQALQAPAAPQETTKAAS
jgi:hypothetical protein